ncbi:flavin-containing monooxygenase [Amycolatopsis echigonensis]|uniref:Flavin-containing monooxygenase 5 n=1 Tax=Amycolatopsis echigonensis TaxID=2576905 RepID=A0A2N3WS92_9PSEU|nr:MULTISPECIES: NAD(P)-binding domain-containing protein [Amycolatopsis]MBB2505518.1 NAD(P)-binding domain-containing protein [Amycolatopsis echigonensis]PKV96726.1 cation diffusion facilitator CzcD-associated flavoprotein CzcO [Amycolatopsis niigatensis]
MSANSFRVCVVGAGSSGIAAVKVLAERGIEVDCCELSDRVGGNWVWGNRNGVSAAYRSLHINTSRQRMEFSDFPMPENLPDFARHDQIADYFAAYVGHFGFGDRIRFGTGVAHVEPEPDGSFSVTLSTGDTERYDAVLVANGHHWDPRMPEPMFPGAEGFRGEIMHSHSYTEEEQLAGRRVVVVGMGNSAMDIAVDASYHAAATYLSARRGVHVIPKYVWGKPYDQIAGKEWLPSALRWPVARKLMAAATGPMTRYGLPEPDHKFAQAHPTMSSRILDRLAHGAITPVPNIERFDGDEVVFTDGRRVAADLVVFCTGYKISFPFFDRDFLDPSGDNEIRLYRRVFHPGVPGLYFVGLVQPLGAIMPIAERQALLIADHLQGRYHLPGAAEMEREIDRHRRRISRRYVASKRHTIQVDYDDYMRDLRLERRRGARRPAGRTPADRPVASAAAREEIRA